MRLAVLGAGAWGTALAIAFSRQHDVTLWAREAVVAQSLREHRENRQFLPGHFLPEALNVTSDFSSAVEAVDVVLVATPVAGLRPTLIALGAEAFSGPILWACKGFEAHTGLLPHQVAEQVLGGQHLSHGALSGPSFAAEVADAQPTALSLATRRVSVAEHLAPQLHDRFLRIYANDDLVGVEVGGAVKNVLAIATGLCDGLGFGLNARAALLTRGLAEIARLGLALGARKDTFLGLSGMGDLILTCTGELSRNRRVGLGLAAGQPLALVLQELGHVAEGVSTAREVGRLAERHAVEMPIVSAVAAILDGRLSARDAVAQLLARDTRSEMF